MDLCGDGTDLKEYWEDYGGAILNTTINKNIYIIAKERVDNEIWLKYSENEIVKRVDDIKNNIWREAMRITGVTKGAEIVCLSDIPKGSGLGGSSSFTVGSLNTLYALTRKYKTPKELAEEASEIEIDILKNPIGKQDQYAAAFGGLNLMEFQKDGEVIVNPLVLSPKLKKTLFSNLLLFHTGVSREASSILTGQKAETKTKAGILHKMKDFAYSGRDALHSLDLRKFGEILHQHWYQKKNLAANISTPMIDNYYSIARESGAIGGKICGAGAGGFLLLYVEPEKQDKVRAALNNLKEYPIDFESLGSKIVYIGD